jgi:hypothetical protein
MATEPAIDRDMVERDGNVTGHHHHVIRKTVCLGQSPARDLLNAVVNDFQWNVRRGRV